MAWKIICKVFKRYAEQQFVKKKVVRSYNLQVENLQIHKRIYKEDKCGIRIVYLVQWVDLDIMDFLGRKEKSEYLNAQNGTNRK